MWQRIRIIVEEIRINEHVLFSSHLIFFMSTLLKCILPGTKKQDEKENSCPQGTLRLNENHS